MRVCGGCTSVVPVASGVFGPASVLDFDDLTYLSNVTSSIVSFADDTCFYLAIENTADQMVLKADLTGNSLKLNENKFQHVAFSTTVPSSDHTYLSPGGLSIESQNIIKDLGVLLLQDCSFLEDFKASSLLCKRLSVWIPLLCLFKSLVLCRITYITKIFSQLKIFREFSLGT